MKNKDLIVLLAVAGGAFFLLPKLMGAKSAPAAGGTRSTNLTPWVYEVARADGWVYYSDGTSIGPDGKYYKGSDLIYNPAGMYQ